MTNDLAYRTYWKRKQLLAAGVPVFSLRRWWPCAGLSDIERVYFDAVRHSASLLDVGAGDMRVQRKFQQAGYQGEYHTQDVGTEYHYTYASLAEVTRSYEAILCLDVIEHLPLADGLALLDRLDELLTPGGVLVVQTPNARCIRHPLSWDMTHVQCYSLNDLWAYLTCLGLSVRGHRVVFAPERRGLLDALKSTVAVYIITRLLGADYADNIALIGVQPDPGLAARSGASRDEFP